MDTIQGTRKEGDGGDRSDDVALADSMVLSPSDRARVLQLWKEGNRPIIRCLELAGFDEAAIHSLQSRRLEYLVIQRNARLELASRGVPKKYLLSENPSLLLNTPVLTFAEQLGVNELATHVYVGKMSGMSQDSIVFNLAAMSDLDLEAVQDFVSSISLHVRPDRRGRNMQQWKGQLAMAGALSIPLMIFMLVKSGLRSDVTLGVVVAVLVLWPVSRAVLGRRAIQYRRQNASDALAAMAEDARGPIVYLRAHVTDGSEFEAGGWSSHFMHRAQMKTLEERIGDAFRGQGPFIALEGPAEGLPHLGAQRVRVGDIAEAGWKDFIRGLLVRAGLVVVRFRPTEAMRWEVLQVLHICPASRIVFVLTTPDANVKDRDDSWHELRTLLGGWMVGELPQRLGKYDYCLAFDAQRQPRLFGRAPRIGENPHSLFSSALIEAAGLDNQALDGASSKTDSDLARTSHDD